MLFAHTYQDPRMLSATQIPAFSASNVSCAFGAYRIFEVDRGPERLYYSQFALAEGSLSCGYYIDDEATIAYR